MSSINDNKDFIYLPNILVEELCSLNLSKVNLSKACRFIKILMMKAKKDNDSDIFCYAEMPYKYLSKIFGNNYKKDFLNSLLEVDIIQTNGVYSKKRKVVLKYKINPEKWRKITYDSIVSNDDVIIINNSVYPIMSPMPDTQVLIEFEFDLQKDLKEVENTDVVYNKNISEIHFKEDKLIKEVSVKAKGIELDTYLPINLDLSEVIPLKIKGEIKYTRYCVAEEQALKGNKVIVKDGKSYKIVNPEEYLERKKTSKYCSDINSVKELERKRFRSSRNETNKRLDTNLTNMSSYLVESIMKDNRLVEIDLCNSQMAISTLVMDIDTDDYRKYKELSLQCSTYEYIQEHFKLSSRSEAKSLVFNIFFSSHKSKGKGVDKMKELFPSVVSWIKEYQKKEGDNQFAILLQRKESEIFIDNLYERLNIKGIFVLTKHDSFIVRKEDEGLVRSIVQEYFDEINFKVMLR